MDAQTLQLMFQHGMGPVGALNMGLQAGTDRQMEQAKLQGAQLANTQQQLVNEQTAAMNPLNQQFMQGRIAQQGAELPGIQGQSQSLVAQGQYDTQTLASKVAGRISQVADQLGADKMRAMGRSGEAATAAAQILSQYPPTMHKELAPQILQKFGVSPDDPIMQGIQSVPPQDVAKSLATVGSGMAMASGDYLQKMGLEVQRGSVQKDIAAGNNETTLKAAKIAADSRVQSAQARIQLMLSKMSTDDKISQLSDMIAKGEASPDQVAQYNQLREDKLRQAAARNPSLPSQITGNPTPVDSVHASPAFNQPQQSKPVDIRSIPQGAVQMLKANPHMKADFDAKYGQGASQQILGY